MKIENVNDIIAFVKEAIKRQYLVKGNKYIYESGPVIEFIIVNNNNGSISINIKEKELNIYSYHDNHIVGSYTIKNKLTDREKALSDLLLSDIKEYRKEQAEKDIATFFDNCDGNKKLAQNINNLDDDEE